MLQGTYLILCILGTALPYSQFIPFLLEHGLNLERFFEQLFTNRISAFFGMDVVTSSLVLWTFVWVEGSRLKMKNLWLYIASNLIVGVSLALPLFLLMRQRKLEETTQFDQIVQS
jgi:magnesium-transporting ATPase (P-type)